MQGGWKGQASSEVCIVVPLCNVIVQHYFHAITNQGRGLTMASLCSASLSIPNCDMTISYHIYHHITHSYTRRSLELQHKMPFDHTDMLCSFRLVGCDWFAPHIVLKTTVRQKNIACALVAQHGEQCIWTYWNILFSVSYNDEPEIFWVRATNLADTVNEITTGYAEIRCVTTKFFHPADHCGFVFSFPEASHI